MSKIILAVNAMISNDNLITNVQRGSNSAELFFIYDRKYKWSLIKSPDDKYSLHYYPGNLTLEALARVQDDEWEVIADMVSYHNDVFSTKEASASMKELHTTLSEKAFGMDDVLNGIIETDRPLI